MASEARLSRRSQAAAGRRRNTALGSRDDSPSHSLNLAVTRPPQSRLQAKAPSPLALCRRTPNVLISAAAVVVLIWQTGRIVGRVRRWTTPSVVLFVGHQRSFGASFQEKARCQGNQHNQFPHRDRIISRFFLEQTCFDLIRFAIRQAHQVSIDCSCEKSASAQRGLRDIGILFFGHNALGGNAGRTTNTGRKDSRDSIPGPEIFSGHRGSGRESAG